MLANRRQYGWLVGSALVAVSALAFLALADIEEQLIYYWTPTELMEHVASNPGQSGTAVRLGGLVESIEAGTLGEELRFFLTDGTTRVAVHTDAVPPAMFRVGIGVVAEGRLGSDGGFETHRLLVKHDNEYRPPHEQDARSLKNRLQALDVDGDVP